MRYTRTAVLRLFLCAFAVLSVPFAARSAELSSTAQGEVAHLLAYIEESSCQFYRNGTWYGDTKAARRHVESKYRYFGGRGLVNSTEDFITWAASKSELSGKPYMVKSGDDTPTPLSQWLTEELGRYRKKTSTSRME